MTCRQLGGACDQLFRGDNFEEIAQQSKRHAIEMIQAKDPAHLEAINKMNNIMQDQVAMHAWVLQKKKEFESLPED